MCATPPSFKRPMIFRSRAATPPTQIRGLRASSAMAMSGIETLQSGLPFTPQLSYNPSTTATRAIPFALLSI